MQTGQNMTKHGSTEQYVQLEETKDFEDK